MSAGQWIVHEDAGSVCTGEDITRPLPEDLPGDPRQDMVAARGGRWVSCRSCGRVGVHVDPDHLDTWLAKVGRRPDGTRPAVPVEEP